MEIEPFLATIVTLAEWRHRRTTGKKHTIALGHSHTRLGTKSGNQTSMAVQRPQDTITKRELIETLGMGCFVLAISVFFLVMTAQDYDQRSDFYASRHLASSPLYQKSHAFSSSRETVVPLVAKQQESSSSSSLRWWLPAERGVKDMNSLRMQDVVVESASRTPSTPAYRVPNSSPQRNNGVLVNHTTEQEPSQPPRIAPSDPPRIGDGERMIFVDSRIQ